jgi:hypothetical protein
MSDSTRATTRCAACGGVVYADALRCKHCRVDRATMIGVADCTGCGDPAPPIGLACPRCGTTRQPTGVAAAAAAGPRCPYCDGRVLANAVRCKHCARELVPTER